jgi:hypothetical protein
MINDIRETTPSYAQTSNTSESFYLYYIQKCYSLIALPGEDFLLEQALSLPQLSESVQTTEDNQSVDVVDASHENASGKNPYYFSDSCKVLLTYLRKHC